MLPLRCHQWRKSSYSANTADCVEVALDSQAARVRDTKARTQGHLEVSPAAWRSLIEQL